MNFTVDASIFITLLVNAVFIVLGILIKQELHDIKSRIVRLEDKLMKSLVPLILLIGICLSADAFAVTGTMGGAVNEPVTAEILCQSPKFCPRIVAVDWSNTSVMYGTDPTCRKSIDGGSTWVACTTQPSATNSNNNIAVAKNGAVIWGGNDALGTVYNIRRSTNGTVSWATVYSTATTDIAPTSTNSSKIKCAQTSSVCLAWYISAGSVVQVLTSLDNGLTWTPGTNGTIASTPLFFAMSTDGTIGIAAPAGPNGSIQSIFYTGGTWQRSALNWATAAGGTCPSSYVVAGLMRTICTDTTLGTNITLRDEEGIVQNTFNLSNRQVGGNAILVANAANRTSNTVTMIGNNSAGVTSIWTSTDQGFTFVSEGELTEQVSTPNDSFQLDGCIYFSYLASGLNGRLTRICP